MLRSFLPEEIISLLSGEWLCEPDINHNNLIHNISTDSRNIKEGDLYIPLIGDKFDGHDFIVDVLNKHLSMVLSDRNLPHEILDQAKQNKIAILKVNNTLEALGLLSAAQRHQFEGPIVAVTGSAGKTTVKQLMHSVMSEKYNTLCTQGNLNNHIGAPKTLLSIAPEHEAAVVELGASGLGEIAYTAQFVKPCVGIITNAGDAHLEGFGSLDGIVKTKGELLDYITGDGVAVLNLDDANFNEWKHRFKKESQKEFQKRSIITFGFQRGANVRAENISSSLSGCQFDLIYNDVKQAISLKLVGEHNVKNALAVAAAAIALDFTFDEIRQGLEKCLPVNGRMEVLPGLKGSIIINDAYNANLASFKAAMDSLDVNQRRILVMGDMAELGAESESHHQQVGEYARRTGIDYMLAVGEMSQHAIESYGKAGQHFIDHKSMIQYLKNNIKRDDVILIKGSRSAGMDIVANALLENSRGN